MLDILSMGVEDTDTFILIFFINCGRKQESALSGMQEGLRAGFPFPPEGHGLTFPDPHALISAAGGQKVARWGPCHGLDLIFMALQSGYTLQTEEEEELMAA